MPAAGQVIRALDFPPLAEGENANDQDDFTNTSYEPGTPELGVPFVAPTSGAVEVEVYAIIRANTQGVDASMSFEVFEGSDASGTLRKSAGDNNAARNEGTDIHSAVGFDTVTGLTPGVTHYARTVQRVFVGSPGDSGDIFHRRILVRPAT